MLRRILAPLAFGALLLPALARAQEGAVGAVRIATCNPVKVFSDLDERRDIEDRMRNEAERFAIEANARSTTLAEQKKTIGQLKPDSEPYRRQMEEWGRKAVEFQFSLEMEKARRDRLQKENMLALYNKIKDACKDIAQQKKIDLVLAERRPDLVDPTLNYERLQQLIGQSDVLYQSPVVDITDAVTLAINQKYAATGGKPATRPAP